MIGTGHHWAATPLEVESELPIGSTFTLTPPRCRCEAAAALWAAWQGACVHPAADLRRAGGRYVPTGR